MTTRDLLGTLSGEPFGMSPQVEFCSRAFEADALRQEAIERRSGHESQVHGAAAGADQFLPDALG